jgi:hypothetical protein
MCTQAWCSLLANRGWLTALGHFRHQHRTVASDCGFTPSTHQTSYNPAQHNLAFLDMAQHWNINCQELLSLLNRRQEVG